MEFFQLVLPVYVDYLGAFEEGLEDIHDPVDVVQELNLHGVQHSRYLPGGELVIEEDQLVLRDSPQRVSHFLKLRSYKRAKNIHDYRLWLSDMTCVTLKIPWLLSRKLAIPMRKD